MAAFYYGSVERQLITGIITSWKPLIAFGFMEMFAMNTFIISP
jgi:hypothetical protein